MYMINYAREYIRELTLKFLKINQLNSYITSWIKFDRN